MSNLTASPYPSSFYEESYAISSWNCSVLKRGVDLLCVLLVLPLLLPVLFFVGLGIWVTSEGPVLILQTRMGRFGETFRALRFRTGVRAADIPEHPSAQRAQQRLTPFGRVLRRYRLDELPLIFNVLSGDMSIVGPATARPARQLTTLYCRPGLVGASALVAGYEGRLRKEMGPARFSEYRSQILLPVQERLEARHMAEATFGSDLRLLVNALLRRSDAAAMATLDEALQGAFERDYESMR